MKVLIIGAGGREHAIATKISDNEKVEKVYLSKDNGGAFGKIEAVSLADSFEEIESFIKYNDISLTIVGPEDPLNAGIVDYLSDRGHKVFGPKKNAALLEGSKGFSKDFMDKYKIPTAKYRKYASYQEALEGLDEFGFPTVVKADGLCQGKGVYICFDKAEADQAIKEIFIDKVFKDQGGSIVLEEYLDGFEASLLCFVSQGKIYPFDTAMDYKKIYENDQGPNTGGVGCLSPNPYWKDDHQRQSDQILAKIEEGLEKESMTYSGILFIGYLIENGRVYVLEFNTRFGDPETEVILPRLESDLLNLILDSIDGKELSLQFTSDHSLALILCSDGYPKSYEKGLEIRGIDIIKDCIIYHNGTKKDQGRLVTNGGRVLTLVGLSDSLEKARKKVYKEVEKIDFDNIYFRKDIGLVNSNLEK